MSLNPTSTQDVSFDSTFRSLSASRKRTLMTKLDRLKGDAIVASLETQADIALLLLREQGRAALADEALSNVGALSSLETHLIAAAPIGEARYRHIVDAYALGAATAIVRW